jgi:hypothetical protein
VLQGIRGTLLLFMPLLAVSLVFSIASVSNHLRLYPATDRPRLFGTRTVADFFPVTDPFPFPTSYVDSPGEFKPTTGRLEGGNAIAGPGDGPGYLLWGPFAPLKHGSYRATFQLAATATAPGAWVATIDFFSSLPDRLLAVRSLTARELAPRTTSKVSLDFSNPEGGLIQTRVWYDGRGTVRAGQVRVESVQVSAPGRFPDWPIALPWVLGTVAAGWLLVLGMKRAQREASA